MTPDRQRPTSGSTIVHGAALTLVVAGLVTLLGSNSIWATCATVRCETPLQAMDVRSGIDFGYGVVTAIAAILLTAIGIDAGRRAGVSPFAIAAVLLALVVILTVSAFVIDAYVIRDQFPTVFGLPDSGTIVTALGGLATLVAGLRLRRPADSPPN
jgi:hypothetical protein